MLTIWKQTFGPNAIGTSEFPVGAKILSCGVQHEMIAIWFLCDPDASKEKRTVAILGTGWKLDSAESIMVNESEFVGTVNTGSVFCPLMFHVFVGKGE